MKVMNLAALVLDERLQSRTEIHQDAVDDYAHAMENGDRFPALTVFFDGIHYYLADGYHRYHAAKKAGKVSAECEIINGTFREAQLYATGVNAKHGMRRSHADKRKAVMTLLDDFEWSQWNNAEIARRANVSVPFVANLRQSGSDEKPTSVKYTTPTGKVAERKSTTERKSKEPELKGPEVKPEPVFDPRDELIETLTKENSDLSDRLAVAASEGTEEEKKLAETTISELREKVRILEIELVAVKSSRDTYQAENMQLRKQVAMLNKKLKAYEEIQ